MYWNTYANVVGVNLKFNIYQKNDYMPVQIKENTHSWIHTQME